MGHDRKQDILIAAMELFSKKGFRGTTTRDLAYQAGVNEAIIFRHFDNKEALYSAILQHKAGESGDVRCEEIEKLAAGNDDTRFFETIGRTFLDRHEQDSSFMRLLLFSALEGHELSEMFVTIMTVRNPLAKYVKRRIDEGAFRPMDLSWRPEHFSECLRVLSCGRKFSGSRRLILTIGKTWCERLSQFFFLGISSR